MTYDYKTQRGRLFTDEGQRLFLAYRDRVNRLLDKAGAYKSGAIGLPPGIGAADSWDLMACDDRLVELGETRELTESWARGQDRVFVRGSK